MSSPLEQRRDALLAELRDMPEEMRWDWLIERAQARPPMPEADRTEDRLVPGCLSQVWIAPSFDGQRCHFACDADAVVVKAVAGLICEFYSDAAPADIVALDPSFLREAGITSHLTAHRRNALGKIWGLIRAFAQRQPPC